MTVPYLKLTKKIGVGIRKACRFYASGKNKNETDFFGISSREARCKKSYRLLKFQILGKIKQA